MSNLSAEAMGSVATAASSNWRANIVAVVGRRKVCWKGAQGLSFRVLVDVYSAALKLVDWKEVSYSFRALGP